MTPPEIIALIIFGPILLYLAARLVTAGYYKSREQYNKRRSRHGEEKQEER